MYFYLSIPHLFLRNTHRYSNYFRTFLPFSTATFENRPTESHFMVDYLTERCGLSREEANKASKTLTTVKSLQNPESVLKFLKQIGFNDTHIKNLILRHPRCLSCRVHKTLKPKVILFQELGLSGATFAGIASKNPTLLIRGIDSHFRPAIDFLRTFLHTDDNIVRAVKKWSWLLTCQYQKVIAPSVEVLRQYGFREHHITNLVLRRPKFITHGPHWIGKLIARVEKMGFKRRCPMLAYAILSVSMMSRTTLETKFKIFKSFGWTQEDIFSAFRRAPNFLMFSETKIRTVMDFLVNEAGYKPSEIVFRPKLFMYSLENRLVPRHEVLKILKSQGLLRPKLCLWSVANMSEVLFLKTYLLRYLDRVPDLREAYMVSIRGELSKAAKPLLSN